MWRGMSRESKSLIQLRFTKLHSSSSGWKAWMKCYRRALRCQTQKEQKFPQKKADRSRILAWEEGCCCYFSPASGSLKGPFLVCLFLKGRLGHPYLQKPSLSKLNLPVSRRQGGALQGEWFGALCPCVLSIRQSPHHREQTMGLSEKER